MLPPDEGRRVKAVALRVNLEGCENHDTERRTGRRLDSKLFAESSIFQGIKYCEKQKLLPLFVGGF